ncbi:unnamed protein product [Arabis nemorensis]|uniref:Protein kinase domain-containing protein n=1 Tax=Arabis nemorensis TaxID=586526 RepID=A0A565BNR8_9BRAS|nr:unnamed protein product [Arabis nemorensis]
MLGKRHVNSSSSTSGSSTFDGKSISTKDNLKEDCIEDGINPLKVLAHGGTILNSLFVRTEGEGVQYIVSEGVHSKAKVVVKRVERCDEILQEFSNQRLSSEDSIHVLRVIDYMHDTEFSYLRVVYIRECGEDKNWAKQRTYRFGYEGCVEGTLGPVFVRVERRIMIEIINRIADIHRKKVIHRSLQPDSIRLVVRDPNNYVVAIE